MIHYPAPQKDDRRRIKDGQLEDRLADIERNGLNEIMFILQFSDLIRVHTPTRSQVRQSDGTLQT